MRKIAAALQKIARSLIFQYVVYLSVAAFISVQLSFYLLYPEVKKLRINNFQRWAEVLVKELPARKDGLPDLGRSSALRKIMNFESWVVDAQGKILVQSEQLPLPLSFDLMTIPTEEMEIVNSPIPGKRFQDLFVIRLINKDPLYLIILPAETSESVQLLVNYIYLLFFWGLGVAMLGMFFILRWKDKHLPPSSPLTSQSGFSLLSAIVALGITALVLVGLQKVLALSFKGGAHADLRSNIRNLSDTIRKTTDCSKTFAGLDVAKVCNPLLPLPILLKDKNNNALTKPLNKVIGIFKPTDDTVEGAGQIGNWYLRASCDSPDGNITVRYARAQSVDKLGKVDFFVDPMTKRPYDWGRSDTNPLFGLEDRVLCKGETGAGASHIATKNMQYAPLPMTDCTSSFSKNARTYLAIAGGAAYTVLMPDSYLLTATVKCPDDKIAVSGGAQCGIGMSIASVVALLGGGGKAPGYLSLSQPTDDGKGWMSACCIEGAPDPFKMPKAYAVCLSPP